MKLSQPMRTALQSIADGKAISETHPTGQTYGRYWRPGGTVAFSTFYALLDRKLIARSGATKVAPATYVTHYEITPAGRAAIGA